MNWFLVLAFLFFAGSLLGWWMEFGFRNLISHKGPHGHFFINPGFCHGPWLPIYGVGLMVMFVISYYMTDVRGEVWMPAILLGIGLSMTLIELVGGWLLLHLLNMRLWDYRHFKGNLGGYICPQFSLIWTALGAVYYLLIHPMAIDGILWLSQHLAFSFVIGLFFGLFIPDALTSASDAAVIREFAQDEAVVVKYEELKQMVQEHRMSNNRKAHFFDQLRNEDTALRTFLVEHKSLMEAKK